MASADRTPVQTDDLSSLEAGLDALETPHHIRRGGSRVRAVLAPLLGALLVLGLWQLAIALEVKPT